MTYNSAKLYQLVSVINTRFDGPLLQRSAVYGVSQCLLVLCYPSFLSRFVLSSFGLATIGWPMLWIPVLLYLAPMVVVDVRMDAHKPQPGDNPRAPNPINAALRLKLSGGEVLSMPQLHDESYGSTMARLVIARVAVPFGFVHQDCAHSDQHPDDVQLLHRPDVAVMEGVQRTVALVVMIAITWAALAAFYYLYGEGSFSYANSLLLRGPYHQSTADFFSAKLDFIQQLRRILV